jgi:uncharacterized membrane protein YcaP (DUF421 family)
LLLGKAPFSFLFELLVRAFVVYVLLLLVLRLLGKRMSGQLTNVELGVMIVLGGIVAVPLEIAERGMLPGLLLLVVVLGVQRGLGYLESRWRRAEAIILGRGSTLVSDGVVQLAALRHARISQQQLFSTLRAAKVRQLGELERVYLETYGFFSLRRRKEPRPGLPVLPDDDPGIAARLVADGTYLVCSYCGLGVLTRPPRCDNCRHEDFRPAVKAADGHAG